MKLRTLSAVAVLFLSAPLLAGCITINVPAPESETGASTGGGSVDDSGADDSAAISALEISTGALFSYVETYSSEDCQFVGVMGQQLEDATPLASYRGKYETIATNMGLVFQICVNDPANVDAVDLALSTRKSLAELLTELDSPLGGGSMPVPGNQAG